MKVNLLMAIAAIVVFFSCTEENDPVPQDPISPIFVEIPDVNFEAQLIEKGIDSDGIVNHKLLSEDADGVTLLNLTFQGTDSEKKITDLTGIEAFKDLLILSVEDNALTSVSLSENTALERLNVNGNMLTSIDLSANASLSFLDASFNELEEIDLKANNNLDTLRLQVNLLKTIDVSRNVNLLELDLLFNELISVSGLEATTKLISLNLSWNYLEELIVNIPSLEDLNVEQNLLSTLNVSGSTSLKNLIATTNEIEGLDVDSNVALEILLVSANKIATINLENNVNLNYLWISSNQLQQLDVSKLTELYDLSIGRNSGLTCVKIADGQLIATVRKQEHQVLSVEGC
ncbi:hypothetical protein [Reichenbachiella sp. MALMAid0571]|uniref:hypothetical protein n=1 Tax=Reichenbachiella sp. MALMAid0571 TaxID=3143939 RepID=UPI0032DF402D